MKVYFTASTNFKRECEQDYKTIVEYLRKKSHDVFEKVLSEHIPDPASVTSHQIKEWHKEWNAYIHDCDFAVVEGSYPSTIHIGFDISQILSRGKSVILLYKKGKDPVFLSDTFSPKLVKSEYMSSNIIEVMDWCLEEISKFTHRRFTFFISSKIDMFLEIVSKKEGVSKAEYIRYLIEGQMNNGK